MLQNVYISLPYNVASRKAGIGIKKLCHCQLVYINRLLSYLLTLLLRLFTSLSIDPFSFQAGDHKRQSDLALVFLFCVMVYFVSDACSWFPSVFFLHLLHKITLGDKWNGFIYGLDATQATETKHSRRLNTDPNHDF